jgi:hypothetical protein
LKPCEAIERSEITMQRPFREESSQNLRNIKSSAAKNSTEPHKKQKSDDKYSCSEHAYKPTHSTADCYTIKNQANTTNHAPRANKRSFSNQSQDIIQEEDSGDLCLCHQERASKVRWQQEARKRWKTVEPTLKTTKENTTKWTISFSLRNS